MEIQVCALVMLISCWSSVSGRSAPAPACHEKSPHLNQCIEDSLNRLIPTLKHGWTDGQVPGLDPIEVPSVQTSFANGAMDVTLATDNVKITGLSDSRVYAVKTKNLYMGKLELVLKVPVLQVAGNYASEGEMATFPLSSSGHFNITMDDVTVVSIIYLEKFTSGSGRRLVIKSFSMDAVPGQIHIKPAPYLDGDDKLGKTLEVYLNENSYELYNMIKTPVMSYFSDLARIMIDSYLAQVPDNQIIQS